MPTSNVRWGDDDSDDEDDMMIQLNASVEEEGEEEDVQNDNYLAWGSVGEMQTAYDSTSAQSNEYRSLADHNNILSRYIHEHDTGILIQSGYLGTSKYIIPLHVPCMVVGHTHKRIAVHDSGTTKLAQTVLVSCLMNESKHLTRLSGLKRIEAILNLADKSMSINDLAPPGFTVSVTIVQDDVQTSSPVVLGYSGTAAEYGPMDLSVDHERCIYRVQTGCPSTRYRNPAGLGATMLCNSVVLMHPDVNQYLIGTSHRIPSSEQKGFLCMCSGSPSAALKGLVRYAVSGSVCRVYSMGVNRCMKEMISYIRNLDCDCRSVRPRVIWRIAGLDTEICEWCCRGLVSLIHKMSNSDNPHCLTFHEGTLGPQRLITLSFCTGALMRLDTQLEWVDSKSQSTGFHDFQMVCSPIVGLVPYIERINPIRAALLNVYMAQTICTPCCRYHPNMVLIPKYSEGLIGSPLEYLRGTMYEDHQVPGLNLMCAFVNTQFTYEDGMVMSRSAAKRFEYECRVSVHMDPIGNRVPSIGTIIEPHSVPWWQNHFRGIVHSINPAPQGMVRVIVVANCWPVNGDKFTTLHGQKGVVTILDDNKMPCIKGRPVDIVIGSSSVVKRQTLSQMIEAAMNMHCVDHMEQGRTYGYDEIERDFGMQRSPREPVIDAALRHYTSSISVDGIYPIRQIKTTRYNFVSHQDQVRVNYGIIRVMQSSYLASFRVSATASVTGPNRINPDTSSSRGGSRSLGEMEVMQMLANGLSYTLSEFSIRSDTRIVEVCMSCRCMTVMCSCASDSHTVDRMYIPNRLYRFALHAYIAYQLKVTLS